MQYTYEEFISILIFIIAVTIVSLVLIFLGRILSRIFGAHSPNSIKNSIFECGFSESGNARVKFDISFYLVAILFLIFDLEIAFMVPWGILLKKTQNGISLLSNEAFLAMVLFLLILFLGFIYEWKKGALEWE